MHEEGAQMNFVFNEPPPTGFDARFTILMALSEGMAKVGGQTEMPKVEVIPMPPNDGIVN